MINVRTVKGDKMTIQSEQQLENRLVSQLTLNGYKLVEISDEDDLIANFRAQVSQHNAKELNGKPLSDAEFERLMVKISGKGVFASSKILREKHDIQRDDGSIIYIELFNSIEWCKNSFQVTHQVTMKAKREVRYDVSILINGLPLVQIELKRRGVDFKEAFHQVERYRREPFSSLFRFIQLFVISNGIDTKYYANSDAPFMFSHTFYWSDIDNIRIDSLEQFAFSFLERCQVSKIIARYMVINETERKLMVMRPYQVYAVERIINHAKTSNDNGYIWHTTGSGKTLTSFKASQILANEPNIDQVIFLVDRKDLDKQTLDEFNKFDPGCVDMTNQTSKLIEQIQDSSKRLIITTIQKMANAVSKPQYTSIIDKYRKKKTIFIIDECHRSQFGDMHKAISKAYTRAQYFGFTGTPRFAQNPADDGRATGDIFGKCLHNYLIKDAIKDGNVLGFAVDYVSTIQESANIKDGKVSSIDTDPVFIDDDRIGLIAANILERHNTKTNHSMYNALFATSSIAMLIKYYDTFKAMNHNLKIAGIFTFASNEDGENKAELSRDAMDRMMVDYNKMFKTNFNTSTFDGYFRDVSKRVKNNDIDILLVVNMFLTGFDARTLNTLYLDKRLEYHNLIQAFSRTNRVEKATKPFGNIVCYQTTKENVDTAVMLYSQTNNTDVVLMHSYQEYLLAFNNAIEDLLNFTSDVEAVKKLEDEKDIGTFVFKFRNILRILTPLKTFIEFDWRTSDTAFDEQTYNDFLSKYLDFSRRPRGEPGEDIISDLNFELDLVRSDKINVHYILELIRQIDLIDKDQQRKDIFEIKEKMKFITDEKLFQKSELIKQFLDRIIPSLSPNDDIDEAYLSMMEEARENEISQFSEEHNIESDHLQQIIEEYEYSGIFPDIQINESIKDVTYLKRRKIVQQTKQFILNLLDKFN